MLSNDVKCKFIYNIVSIKKTILKLMLSKLAVNLLPINCCRTLNLYLNIFPILKLIKSLSYEWHVKITNHNNNLYETR